VKGSAHKNSTNVSLFAWQRFRLPTRFFAHSLARKDFGSCYRMKPIAIPIEELTLEQARAKLAACREHNAALAAELVTCTKEVAELRKEKVALLAELEPYRAQIALVSGC
jgi:hypothetical protein